MDFQFCQPKFGALPVLQDYRQSFDRSVKKCGQSIQPLIDNVLNRYSSLQLLVEVHLDISEIHNHKCISKIYIQMINTKISVTDKNQRNSRKQQDHILISSSVPNIRLMPIYV